METTTPMVETTLTVQHEHGLHARPADLFVRCANGFQSTIHVYNLTRNADKKANAKSILGILSIGVRNADEVRIAASGPDAAQAVAALQNLIQNNFEG